MTEGRPAAGPGRIAWRWVLALLGPALFGAYAALDLTALAWVALVPWLVLYTDDRHPRVSLLYFPPAVWLTILALYPQTFRFGSAFPIAFATVFMVPWLPFAPAIRSIHRRFGLPRTLTVPLVWVAVEWLRSRFSLSHFDVYSLGYSQAHLTPLIQIADVTGVYGVSFLVAAVNGFVADVLFALRDHGWGGRRVWLRRRIAPAGASVALLLLACWLYGAARLATLESVPGPRLAIVQPNIRHTVSNAVGVHLTQLMMTYERVPAGEVDAIVWPENAILDNLHRQGAYLDDLARLSEAKRAWLLVGSMGKPPEHPGRTTNGAFLIDREGRVVDRYDKQILFPWSEYVPLDRLLGRVAPPLQRLQRTLVRRGWGFMPVGVAGESMRLLELPWNGGALAFATLICVENTYPPLPAEAGRLGARFFINITSEGEIGGTLQKHLLRTAMLRAAENKMAYVRLGNTGISCFIDPAGRLQSLLIGEGGGAIFDAGVLIDRVALSSAGPTLYARSHDAFAKACGVATLVLLLLGLARRGRGPWAATPALLACLVAASGCGGGPTIAGDVGQAADELQQGRRLLRQGDHEQALRALARACVDAASCEPALPGLERCFVETGRIESGVVFFTDLIARHPGLEGAALGHRGYLLEQAVEMRRAERDYQRAVELRPDPLTSERLGSLRMRLEDREGALAAFREGLRARPDHVELRYLLARTLRLENRLEESRELLEQVLRDDPAHADVWTNLGRIHAMQGKPEAAETAFMQAIALEPRAIEPRYQLTKLALARGDRSRAGALIREIRAIEDTFVGRGPRPAPEE